MYENFRWHISVYLCSILLNHRNCGLVQNKVSFLTYSWHCCFWMTGALWYMKLCLNLNPQKKYWELENTGNIVSILRGFKPPRILYSRGCMYNTCICSVMLHVGETQTLLMVDFNHWQQNDRAMIHWTRGMSTEDKVIRLASWEARLWQTWVIAVKL